MGQIESRLQGVERAAKHRVTGDYVAWYKSLQGEPGQVYWQRMLDEVGSFLIEGTPEQFVAQVKERRMQAAEALALFGDAESEVSHGFD